MFNVNYNSKMIIAVLAVLMLIFLVGVGLFKKAKINSLTNYNLVSNKIVLDSDSTAATSSLIDNFTYTSTNTKQMVSSSSQVINVANLLIDNIKPDTTKINTIKATNLNNKILTPVKTVSSVMNSNVKAEVMAWIYPGSATCNAKTEYSDGRKVDVLKPEYFSINESGNLILLTTQKSGCNGYSVASVADLKKYSKEQYVTISSSYAGSMDLFLTNSLNDPTNINTIVSFIVDNDLTGAEIDFEDFGGWSSSIYSNYKQFITKLGSSLHAKHKKLMIDGPATSNVVEEAWYVWRYLDFNNLPVDQIVVMAYDYQYDQGAGQPIAPISWIQDNIKFILSRFPNKSKISIGVPSYGYKGIINTQKFSLLTYNQIKKEPGFSTATRDPNSFEMTWQNSDNVYFYQDSESILKKVQIIQSAGINSISIWHLGGNEWLTTK